MAVSKVKSKSLIKNKISSKAKLTTLGGIGAIGIGALALGLTKMKSGKTKETKVESLENKKLIEMLSVQQEMIKNLQKNINENEIKFNKHIENYTQLNDNFIILDKKFGFLERELKTNHGLQYSYYGYF